MENLLRLPPALFYPEASAPLTIGQAEQQYFMDGWLDEIAIYNRALADDEIQSIFNVGHGGRCIDLASHP